MTPTPISAEGTRPLTLLVEGTQANAQVLYEINGTEFVAGNVGSVKLPWTTNVDALSGSEVRLLADGLEEYGDLRCRITGPTVPTPGIMDYDPNPYPQVECILVVP